jgi:hypothetical protein
VLACGPDFFFFGLGSVVRRELLAKLDPIEAAQTPTASRAKRQGRIKGREIRSFDFI